MALTKGFKKFVGLIGTVVVVAGVAVAFHKGLFNIHKSDTQDASVPTFQSSAPTASVAPQASVMPSNFKASADSLASITQNCVVRISVENPSEPIYGETGGMPHGFNYDFAKLLFAQPEFAQKCPNGVAIDTKHEVDTYENVPRQLLLTQNGATTVDIAMDGLTYSDNSPAQGIMYSKAYLKDFGYALIVPKGSSIHSDADLNGKVVGILQGDSDVKAFVQRKFPGATFKEVSDSGSGNFILKAVDGGDVDAFVYDYPFAVPLVNNTDMQIAESKIDGSDFNYKIGLRSTDQNLLFALNAAIDRVTQTNDYTDLMRKYFISNQVATTAATGGERTYTVKQGDTLALIAHSQMGSAGKYRAIQKRNNLPNPNLIMVGQHLVIPQA
jgi:ABC-type amino acid transport substrate-binding protein